MELDELNEQRNIFCKKGNKKSWLPDLSHPAMVIGYLDTHYNDTFEAYDNMIEQHDPAFFLIHLN